MLNAMNSIPRIKSIVPQNNYKLAVVFDDGCKVIYDVAEDIASIDCFSELKTINGLWNQAQLDSSRTVVYWNENIDLPSDTIYEYGKRCK